MSTAPSAWRVQEVVSLAQSTLAVLAHEHGLVLDSDDDILAVLAEEHVDLEGVLTRLVRCALDAKAMGVAAEARISDLRGRRERFQTQEATLRKVVQAIMDAMGMKAFRTGEFSLSLSSGRPSTVITNEDDVPDEFWKTTRSLDKAAINEAMKTADVPGCQRTNGAPSLTVRTK